MQRFAAVFLFWALPLFCQSNNGELRLKVADPSGHGAKITIHIISAANQYRNALTTNDEGELVVQRLPFGVYQLEIEQPGFETVSQSVDIHSSLQTERMIELKLPTVNESATVSAANTLVDPIGQARSVKSAQTRSKHGSVRYRAVLCRTW